MNNNRPLIIVACVVLAIVGGSLWFLNSQQPLPAPVTPGAKPLVEVPVGPQIYTPPPLDSGSAARKPTLATEDRAATAKPKGTPRPLEEWEIRIDEVLRSNADESQTAQILINMLPTLPPDGQSEAAQHIANLILDEEYSKVLPLVKNPNLPEDVLDVFVTDLMNREDNVKLPALLDIAKIPNHPHHEEALTDLEIFLDEDYGNDWSRWQQALDKYLKEQAAEEAASAPAPVKK
jgi:hypothetical protein